MPPSLRASPYKNHFLAGLPAEELKTLQPHMHIVAGKLGTVLFGEEKSVQYLYFPVGAVVSLVANFQDGKGVEVALIGSEGLVGVWAAMGGHSNWHEAVVQAPGNLLKLSVDVFRAELIRSAPLRDQLNRYMLFLLAQVSQTAGCNRLHRLEQRLSRWLLMTHDQVRTEEFDQTHEFLSHMLGTDRSEVTIAAGILRTAGLISYSRGKVKIIDRKGLEDAACECYAIFAGEAVRLREKRT
jgi:CRP-like cAMP-binding protein